MASQRTPEQLKSIILKATQHLVAVGGMQNFSYPKLAAETGINAPTVYEHYKNKEALLTTCFLTIDNEIACKIANAPKNLSAGVKDLQSLDNLCWLLWLPYWNYLTADYDRTLFYWHFCNSEYYTPAVVQQRMQNGKAFWELVQSVNGLSPFSERCNLEMLVWNLLDNTVAMAAKVLRGIYPNDEVNVNTVYHIVFQPVFSMFGQNSGDDNKEDGKMLPPPTSYSRIFSEFLSEGVSRSGTEKENQNSHHRSCYLARTQPFSSQRYACIQQNSEHCTCHRDRAG